MERNKQGFTTIAVDLAKETAKNFLMGMPSVRRWRLQRPRTAPTNDNIIEFLDNYAFASVRRLHKYVGDFTGKSVCEIGAGDYLTSGLSILAAGAKSYAVIDRFPGDYYGEQAKFWYKNIEKNWSQAFPGIPWDESLDAENFPENNMERIKLISEPIETAETEEKFDIVCSFQVGEHVTDINAFADIHNRILKPDGVGLHRVDYGPHDCWFYYRDPLTFLRFPDFIWQLTGSNRGTPNRRRHHEFMEAFRKADLDVEIVEQNSFDKDEINFKNLHKKFQAMPEESLEVGNGIYLLKLSK